MKRWLPNSEAAELLAVDERTIKRWMTYPATRDALTVVRHGKQWRIPRPADLDTWESETRARLETLGVSLRDSFELGLKRAAKRFNHGRLESYRLWLAALAKVLEQGAASQDARKQILWLWHAANAILDPLPRHEMEADKLKPKFPDQLRSRRLRNHEVDAIMARWPNERHLKRVRDVHTLQALEEIRRRFDYAQAVCELKQSRQRPTEKNLRPLLHKDFTAHINDTREELPACVIDRRLPQKGLKRHTVRKRYPKKGAIQTRIQAELYGTRESIPCVDERHDGKKTPKRGPRDEIDAPLRRPRS